jgi:hypothetical protein
MKRIIPLILGSVALIVAFPPAVKAQEINIGPGGVTIQRHHRYSREDWERERERERQLHWRQEFYERHGYYPDGYYPDQGY